MTQLAAWCVNLSHLHLLQEFKMCVSTTIRRSWRFLVDALKDMSRLTCLSLEGTIFTVMDGELAQEDRFESVILPHASHLQTLHLSNVQGLLQPMIIALNTRAFPELHTLHLEFGSSFCRLYFLPFRLSRGINR